MRIGHLMAFIALHRTFAEYREVEDLYFPNYDNARYALNWMKLRVWGMDDYDAVILIDSDITVHQDLTHLFHLPTDFAWASDQVCPSDSQWMLLHRGLPIDQYNAHHLQTKHLT